MEIAKKRKISSFSQGNLYYCNIILGEDLLVRYYLLPVPKQLLTIAILRLPCWFSGPVVWARPLCFICLMQAPAMAKKEKGPPRICQCIVCKAANLDEGNCPIQLDATSNARAVKFVMLQACPGMLGSQPG